MTVQEAMKMLLKMPMDATLAVALDADKMVHIENIGVIPEGVFGIYKPKLVYIELSEEEL